MVFGPEKKYFKTQNFSLNQDFRSFHLNRSQFILKCWKNYKVDILLTILLIMALIAVFLYSWVTHKISRLSQIKRELSVRIWIKTWWTIWKTKIVHKIWKDPEEYQLKYGWNVHKICCNELSFRDLHCCCRKKLASGAVFTPVI